MLTPVPPPCIPHRLFFLVGEGGRTEEGGLEGSEGQGRAGWIADSEHLLFASPERATCFSSHSQEAKAAETRRERHGARDMPRDGAKSST